VLAKFLKDKPMWSCRRSSYWKDKSRLRLAESSLKLEKLQKIEKNKPVVARRTSTRN